MNWLCLGNLGGATMSDREQEQRERAYRLWEEEGRPEGSHDDHWKRSEHPADISDQESEDVTKVNQEADAEFSGKADAAEADAATIRPPSSVAPD
jgi:hypothetical protein